MTPAQRLQGAVIGSGFVSRHHLDAWNHSSQATIVAVCDRDSARADLAASRVPGALAYHSASELFAHHRLDFVEICTGPESHRELTEMAARHGAHVLCQKPSAPERADLLAMIDACRRAGIRLMIHENWRFRPWYRVLREQINTGAIGRPIRLRLSHRDTRALRPDGFADQPFLAQRTRLILFEMGPHMIDMARFLMGEVTDVSAKMGRFGKDHPGEDLAILTLGFESGAIGLIDLSWCASPDLAQPEWALNETVVEGELGRLRVLSDGNLEHEDLEGRKLIISVELPGSDDVYLDAYIRVHSHFIQGLLHGSPHETNGEDNLRTMDVLWSAYESNSQQKTLTVANSMPGNRLGRGTN